MRYCTVKRWPCRKAAEMMDRSRWRSSECVTSYQDTDARKRPAREK